jgi:hypothetical protein
MLKEKFTLTEFDRIIDNAFVFFTNPTLSKIHNASIYLMNMPVWSYFSRPTNMAFPDLTSRIKPPKNLRSLLGMDLKYIPNHQYNVHWTQYDKVNLPRSYRDIKVKTFMAGHEVDDEFNPKLYAQSKWTPPLEDSKGDTTAHEGI